MAESKWVDKMVQNSPLGIVRGTQQANIASLTVTATTGSLPTANGSITIANAATPTVAELQEFCVELNAKLNAALAVLDAYGQTA